MSVTSDSLTSVPQEPIVIFADADTVRAVFYTDAPYHQAMKTLKMTFHVHYTRTCHWKNAAQGRMAAYEYTVSRRPRTSRVLQNLLVDYEADSVKNSPRGGPAGPVSRNPRPGKWRCTAPVKWFMRLCHPAATARS